MDTSSLQMLLGIAIFAILFSIGVGLSLADFKAVIARPRAFVIALACQILLLPVAALTIAGLFGLRDAAAFGLLLLAVCPGGVTSNVFTRMSDGSTALSVALTGVNSMLAVVTIPAALYVGSGFLSTDSAVVTIPFDFLIKQLFVITFVPVALGMAVNYWAPGFAARLQRPLFMLTAALFFLLIAFVWVAEFETYRQAFIAAGVPTLTLFLVTCAISLGIARVANLARSERISMVFEVGIQNPPVAFFIAVNILEDFALLPPSAVYAVVMVVAGALLVPLIRRLPSFP